MTVPKLRGCLVAVAVFSARGCSDARHSSQPVRVESRTLDGKPYSLTGRDAVLHCVMVNDTNHLRQLVAEGQDIKSPFRELANGWTVLHLAAQEGHVEVARLLIENGANVVAKSANGATPLSIAESNHRTEVIELFRKYVGK